MPTAVNYAALEEELKIGKGFSSYGVIVEWLKQEHGQDIEYATVYAWVRYRLGAKLKVPRPQSHKQEEKLVSELKKTRHHSQLSRCSDLQL
ncbi:MAG: winged helix-turn-helix domain-containing protein [Nostoc indistinguendum CM1-VF10]|jgi:transposase|nr:winged helix-turn-helix domain-containing protein [Nostoc indistinguendum CM1-VF10]